MADLSEALKWLAENLEEVALDQEAEGFDPTADGTPLVTISKESVDAIENDLFKKVLAGVGVIPPNDEQVSQHFLKQNCSSYISFGYLFNIFSFYKNNIPYVKSVLSTNSIFSHIIFVFLLRNRLYLISGN